jgi:F-type H+-transporting ATPase subunit b
MTLSKIRTFWQGLALAMVAFSVLSVPARLLAQAENQTAKQAQAKAEAREEAEQTNEYRHSPTVEWISNTMHLPLETTARGFEIINFAVIALAIGIPLIKVLPKTLRTRKESLSQELETARSATEDANARLKAVEEKLAGLDQEIAKIRQQVEQDMREDEERIKNAIGEESARIVAAAEQDISVAAAHARRELKQFAAGLAIDRALERLTITSEIDHELVAEFSRSSGTDVHRRSGEGRN